MSDKAKHLLLEVVQEYQSGDGATRLGSYQDAVADLLHLAHDDEILRIECSCANGRDWIGELQNIAYQGVYSFEEERQQAEYKEVNEIALKDLPLYIDHDWEFESSRDRVEERLKEGK
jgi:hypothetical protein